MIRRTVVPYTENLPQNDICNHLVLYITTIHILAQLLWCSSVFCCCRSHSTLQDEVSPSSVLQTGESKPCLMTTQLLCHVIYTTSGTTWQYGRTCWDSRTDTALLTSWGRHRLPRIRFPDGFQADFRCFVFHVVGGFCASSGRFRKSERWAF